VKELDTNGSGSCMYICVGRARAEIAGRRFDESKKDAERFNIAHLAQTVDTLERFGIMPMEFQSRIFLRSGGSEELGLVGLAEGIHFTVMDTSMDSTYSFLELGDESSTNRVVLRYNRGGLAKNSHREPEQGHYSLIVKTMDNSCIFKDSSLDTDLRALAGSLHREAVADRAADRAAGAEGMEQKKTLEKSKKRKERKARRQAKRAAADAPAADMIEADSTSTSSFSDSDRHGGLESKSDPAGPGAKSHRQIPHNKRSAAPAERAALPLRHGPDPDSTEAGKKRSRRRRKKARRGSTASADSNSSNSDSKRVNPNPVRAGKQDNKSKKDPISKRREEQHEIKQAKGPAVMMELHGFSQPKNHLMERFCTAGMRKEDILDVGRPRVADAVRIVRLQSQEAANKLKTVVASMSNNKGEYLAAPPAAPSPEVKELKERLALLEKHVQNQPNRAPPGFAPGTPFPPQPSPQPRHPHHTHLPPGHTLLHHAPHGRPGAPYLVPQPQHAGPQAPHTHPRHRVAAFQDSYAQAAGAQSICWYEAQNLLCPLGVGCEMAHTHFLRPVGNGQANLGAPPARPLGQRVRQCRDWANGNCSRPEGGCRFAHTQQ